MITINNANFENIFTYLPTQAKQLIILILIDIPRYIIILTSPSALYIENSLVK